MGSKGTETDKGGKWKSVRIRAMKNAAYKSALLGDEQ